MSLQTRLEALISAIGADIKSVRTTAVVATSAATSITLALADAGDVYETTAATAVTLTVPPNSSVAFPIGSMIEFTQMGAGQITFTPGAGVTIRSRGSVYKMAGQYGVAYIRKTATDEWVLTGDLIA